MTSKKVRFHADASLEYEAAFEWYLARSEAVAARFVAEFEDAIAAVAAAPARWPASVHGVRKFHLNRFPFAIIYRELSSDIQVLAVTHARRRPGYWKKRL